MRRGLGAIAAKARFQAVSLDGAACISFFDMAIFQSLISLCHFEGDRFCARRSSVVRYAPYLSVSVGVAKFGAEGLFSLLGVGVSNGVLKG